MDEKDTAKILLDMSTDIDALKLLVLVLYKSLPAEHRLNESAQAMFSDFLTASRSSNPLEDNGAYQDVARRASDILSYLQDDQNNKSLLHLMTSKTLLKLWRHDNAKSN